MSSKVIKQQNIRESFIKYQASYKEAFISLGLYYLTIVGNLFYIIMFMCYNAETFSKFWIHLLPTAITVTLMTLLSLYTRQKKMFKVFRIYLLFKAIFVILFTLPITISFITNEALSSESINSYVQANIAIMRIDCNILSFFISSLLLTAILHYKVNKIIKSQNNIVQ